MSMLMVSVGFKDHIVLNFFSYFHDTSFTDLLSVYLPALFQEQLEALVYE